MRRELPGGYELDDDPRRIDVDAVHDYLANESSWAKGRPREVMERLVREASRVVGLYHDGRQVGFSRVLSDGAIFAYLADVYVLEEHRGHGLGFELVRVTIEGSPFSEIRWVLGTLDAQEFYGKFGFGPTSDQMERPGAE